MKYLLFLCCFLLSCSYGVRPLKLHNTVAFDPGFSQHDQDTIMRGLGLWSKETNGRVDFTLVTENPDINIILGTEAMAEEQEKPNNNLPHDMIGLSYAESGQLYLFISRIQKDTAGNQIEYDAALAETAAHEGGHQIGMIHVPQNETALMDPALNSDIVFNLRLTNYDIAQFCDYWGCQDYNPSLPLNN